MGLPVEYLLRETSSNIKRNLTLSIASFLTMAVSLTLFGTSFIARYAVGNATAKWGQNIEMIVYVKPLASGGSQDQWDAIGKQLKDSPNVKEAKWFGPDSTLKEFESEFPDQAQTKLIKSEDLPPSWRVVPADKSEASIRALVAVYEKVPGVFAVRTALDTVRTINRVTNLGRNFILAVSLALLVAVTLLIGNTIRTAIFARRREIEVMKLVGATNWFIRVPFMLEGFIQGTVGAGISVGGVWCVKRFFFDKLHGDRSAGSVALLRDFFASSAQFRFTAIVLLLLGALIGILSSAVSISRYLDV